ncbi:MAG: hypothetical protein R3Y64_05475 [Peptostreptococcaceae bacterium]
MQSKYDNMNEMKSDMKKTAKKAEYMGKELANDVKHSFQSALNYAEEKMDNMKDKATNMKDKMMK